MHWHKSHKDKDKESQDAAIKASTLPAAPVEPVTPTDDTTDAVKPILSNNSSSASLVSSLSFASIVSRRPAVQSRHASSVHTTATASSSSSNPAPAEQHHAHKSKKVIKIPKLSDFKTPLELVETAIGLLLTIPGPPLSDLQGIYLPQLYHSAYSHRVNTRELDLAGLLKVVVMFRERFRTMRLRFTRTMMDQDGSATLDAGAVGLIYELVAMPHGHHSDVIERRTTALAVVKIYKGKLAQSDIVIDTVPFMVQTGAQELSCLIM